MISLSLIVQLGRQDIQAGLLTLLWLKKPDEKWRTYVDFTNLNKARLNDSFAMPMIDQLVDAMTRHELLIFMDSYLGYNQFPMYCLDEDHTAFLIDRGL